MKTTSQIATLLSLIVIKAISDNQRVIDKIIKTRKLRNLLLKIKTHFQRLPFRKLIPLFNIFTNGSLHLKKTNQNYVKKCTQVLHNCWNRWEILKCTNISTLLEGSQRLKEQSNLIKNRVQTTKIAKRIKNNQHLFHNNHNNIRYLTQTLTHKHHTCSWGVTNFCCHNNYARELLISLLVKFMIQSWRSD